MECGSIQRREVEGDSHLFQEYQPRRDRHNQPESQDGRCGCSRGE
jgi:hypothetical protein